MNRTPAVYLKTIALLLVVCFCLASMSPSVAETPVIQAEPPVIQIEPAPQPTPVPTPVPTQEEIINGYIETICEQYGVEPEIVQSMVYYESRYDPKAKNGQYVGLMQISKTGFKARAKALGVTDFYDPYSNILLGTDFLAELINTYGDVDLALMLYSMNWKDAFAMHKKGKVNNYAYLVLKRAEELKQGVT